MNSQVEHQEEDYEVSSKFDEGLFLKMEQQVPVSDLSGVIQPHIAFGHCYISGERKKEGGRREGEGGRPT